jgi:hypothetical protein
MAERKLWTRLSRAFDPFARAALLCSEDRGFAAFFDERGVADPEEEGWSLLEIVPTVYRPADSSVLADACRSLGIALSMPDEEAAFLYGDEAVRMARSAGRRLRAPGTRPHELLCRAEVRAALEARGCDSYEGVEKAATDKGRVIIVWRPGSYHLVAAPPPGVFS